MPSALEKVLHPRFLTLGEQEQIADLRAAGGSIETVAVALGPPPSTINRELAGNADSDGVYRLYAAQRAAAGRRARP